MQQNKQPGAALVRNTRTVSTFSRFRNVAVLSALIGGVTTTGRQITLPKVHIPQLKPLSALTIQLLKPLWAESATETPKPKELTKEEMKQIAIKAVKETMNGTSSSDANETFICLGSNLLSNGYVVVITVRVGSSTLLLTTTDSQKMDSDGNYIIVESNGYELGFKLSNNPKNPPQIFVHNSFKKTGVADAIVVLDYEGGNGAIFTMGDNGYGYGSFPFKRVVGNKSVNYTPSEVTASVSATVDGHLVIGLMPMVDYIPADISTYYGIGTGNITSKGAIYPLGELVIAKENSTIANGKVTISMTTPDK
ncbi:hypothetical protein AUJ13_02090 [Candidatus Micrarchaeota archaeon CG1_02_49_24]|nr:MAG: hypothetical protein AUJ13_02090 [Candidatus Micrarchaeota archaeon CG1_02_49_24]